MATKTFAEKLNEARLISDAVKKNVEALKGVSLGEKEALEIESLLVKVQEKNAKQEKLKADLKTCTSELNDEMKKLYDLVIDAKKRVKLSLPASQWKEFGIEDKK